VGSSCRDWGGFGRKEVQGKYGEIVVWYYEDIYFVGDVILLVLSERSWIYRVDELLRWCVLCNRGVGRGGHVVSSTHYRMPANSHL